MAMEREKLVSLVSAAQNGDPDALNELFNAFYNDVYYFALKTVKDDELACDITQEAFVEVINTLGNLNEPAAFVTWIKQITYHQCTRYFKKKKDVIVDEDEDGNTVFDTLKEENTEFIPDEALDKSDFKKTIMAILDELSEEQRSATMMFYFDEMSVKQIAEIQGVSEGTVKSRLNYARKAIKSSVEEYEKKNGIKLHALPFFPFFKWLFEGSFGGLSPVSANLIAKGVSTATGTAITASATVTTASVATTAAVATGTAASATVATTAATTAAAGIGAKIVALPIVTKVVAGIVAASIVVGGTTAVVLNSNEKSETADTQSVVSFVSSVVSSLNETTTSEDISSLEETSSNETSSSETPSKETASTEGSQEGTIEGDVIEHTPYPVPEGCTYTTKAGKVYKAGESVTEPVRVGDTFVTEDYTYSFTTERVLECMDDIFYEQGWFEIYPTGWSVKVNDKTKTSYSPFIEEINGVHLKSLYETFMDCTNLVSAPTIPNGVDNLSCTFSGCSSLVVPPNIPNSVTQMYKTFAYCSSLEKTPFLPDSVISLDVTFQYCKALTTITNLPSHLGNLYFAFDGCAKLVNVPTIPNTVIRMSDCFQGCSSLVTAPVIPSSVQFLDGVFWNCFSLTGTVEINATLGDIKYCDGDCNICNNGEVCESCGNCSPYANVFPEGAGSFILTGTSNKLEEIASTNKHANITIK